MLIRQLIAKVKGDELIQVKETSFGHGIQAPCLVLWKENERNESKSAIKNALWK